jgi:nitrate reductase NapAB chaperone NapD
MIVAGVVIRTLPGSTARVEGRLGRFQGLRVQGSDGEGRLAAVWEGESGRALESFAEELLAADEEVLGVFPVYVGEEGA